MLGHKTITTATYIKHRDQYKFVLKIEFLEKLSVRKFYIRNKNVGKNFLVLVQTWKILFKRKNYLNIKIQLCIRKMSAFV